MINYFMVDKNELSVFASLCEEDAEIRFSELHVAVGAISEEEGDVKPVGILIAHMTESELVLDWIYVEEAYRRQGIGSGLLGRIMESGLNIRDLEGVMAVLTEADEEVLNFLDAANYAIIPAENAGQLHVRLFDFEGADDEGKTPGVSSILLSKVPIKYLRAFEDYIKEESLKTRISQGVSYPILPVAYANCSTVIMYEDEVCGMVLLKEENPGYSVPWIYVKPSHEMDLPFLLNETYDNIMKETGNQDVPMMFGTLNEDSVNLVEKLFPDADFEQLLIAYYSYDG